MKFLKDFYKFQVFESIVEKTEEIQKQAEQSELDLKDPYTQKIIADELAKKIDKSGEELNLELDFEKIAKKVQSQTESKIFEKEEGVEIEKDEIKKSIDSIAKLESIFKKENFLKMIEEHAKLKPEDIKPAEVKIETTKWQKLVLNAILWISKTYNLAKNTLIWKGVSRVLSFILSIYASVRKLIRSIISWITRTIFGASHVTTSRVGDYSTLFSWFVPIVIGFVLFTFPAMILGGAAITFTSVLAALTTSLLSSFTSLYSGIFYVVQLCLGIYRSKSLTFEFDDKKTSVRADQALVFGFLDNLEKVLGIKIKMSQTVRDYLKDFEDTMIRRISTGNYIKIMSGKKIYERNFERAKAEAKILNQTQEINIHPAGLALSNLSSFLKKYILLDEKRIEKIKEFAKVFYNDIANKKEKNKATSIFKNRLNSLLNSKQKDNLINSETEILKIINELIVKAEKNGKFTPIPHQIIQSKITKAYMLENHRLMNFFNKIVDSIEKDGKEELKELGSTGYFARITGFQEGIPLINELVWNSLGYANKQEIDARTIKEWELWCSKRWYRPLDYTVKDLLILYASPELKKELEKINLPTRIFIPATKYANEKKIDSEEEYRKLRDELEVDKIERLDK